MRLVLIGANRGGQTFTQLAQPAALPGHLAVTVVDREGHRARRLAKQWQSFGYSATAKEEFAASVPEADIQVWAIDDLWALTEGIESFRRGLFQFAILISASLTPWGGRVLGFGGSLNPASEGWQQGAQLVRRLANLVGERVSSARLTAPLLNEPQARRTRLLLHQRLAWECLRYLQGEKFKSHLFLCESLFSPHCYELLLASAREFGIAPLRDQALALAPSPSRAQDCVITFYREEEMRWLCLLFLTWARDHWRCEQAIQLPPANPDVAISRQVFATD